jgi:hypothetical protein
MYLSELSKEYMNSFEIHLVHLNDNLMKVV